MSTKMGWEGVLQIKISAAFVDVLYVTDSVNFKDEVSKEDATTRAGEGNAEYEPGLFDGEITFKIQKRTGDTTFPALLEAFRTRAAILVKHADQDPAVVGADVYTAWMKVFAMSPAQPIGGIQTWDVTLAPTPGVDVPARATTVA